MKKISNIPGIIILGIALLMSSCKKDFLETKPLSEISQLDVWSDPTLTETFVNGIYNRLEEPLIKYSRSIYVDESQRRANQTVLDFNNCLLTADQIPGWTSGNADPYMLWKPLYASIRSCNLFFDNLKNIPDDNTLIDGKTLKERLTGEVHFLRAWFYFNLTNLYGGVPIISNVYQLTDSFSVPRNSYADCIKFIAADCDSAAGLLPLVQTGNNKGRATEGAALSFDAAVAYASRARGKRRRPSFGWDSLTPTELSVAELVAEGCTNQQIGKRLFVSPGTAKTHLAHILAKLGLTNRAEIAAEVVRRRASAR